MSMIVYKKSITPLDIANLLKEKNIKPSDVTIEETPEEIRIMIKNVLLTEIDLSKIDVLLKMYRRI